MANEIKFGLSKVYYAVYDETEQKYGTPIHIPGAVSMSISPEGDSSTFYADNTPYVNFSVNAGYSGDFEMAVAPQSVLVDLLGQETDKNGVLVESATDKQKTFALLYEVEGNLKNQRFCFYNCTLARPDSEANTQQDSTDPDTDTLNITMISRSFTWGSDTKEVVKASVTDETATKTIYDAWYTEVYTPEKASA